MEEVISFEIELDVGRVQRPRSEPKDDPCERRRAKAIEEGRTTVVVW